MLGGGVWYVYGKPPREGVSYCGFGVTTAHVRPAGTDQSPVATRFAARPYLDTPRNRLPHVAVTLVLR